MPNSTNFNFPLPADTDLVKDGASAIRSLGNSIDTQFVDLKGGTTGQVLSKASGTDLDFTWSSVDPLTILDAKADLITATAADTPARLAVGTDGQILTADSTTSTGLKWATSSSGSLTLLSTTSLSGTSTTISSIPSGYRNLYIEFQKIYGSTSGTLQLNINGNASQVRCIRMTGSTVTDETEWLIASIGSNSALDEPFWVATINNYADATYGKSLFSYGGRNGSSNARVIGGIYNIAGAAITSLQVTTTSGTITLNGTVRIYGVN